MERFVEMPVIGAMLLLALFPILASKSGFSSVYERFLEIVSTPTRVGVLLGIAFVVGVVGNQLIDEAFNRISDAYEEAVEGSKAECKKCKEECRKCKEKCKDQNKDTKKATNDTDCLPKDEDVVEYVVSGDNEYARNYFERHRLFMRIDRAGLVAMILLYSAMLIYRFRRHDRSRGYIEAMIGVMALAFFIAYRTERDAIDKRRDDLRAIVKGHTTSQRDGGPTPAPAASEPPAPAAAVKAE